MHATADAIIQELVDLATIRAALRAAGGRLDESEAAANQVQRNDRARVGAAVIRD